MNKPKPTAEQVARRFGVTVDAVKRQYARNAAYLRKAETIAGSGTHRGYTKAQYSEAAAHAEQIASKP